MSKLSETKFVDVAEEYNKNPRNLKSDSSPRYVIIKKRKEPYIGYDETFWETHTISTQIMGQDIPIIPTFRTQKDATWFMMSSTLEEMYRYHVIEITIWMTRGYTEVEIYFR